MRMEEPVELPPGTELDGRFRIRSLLGEGGMGCVYLAEDLDRGHDVALKILIPRYRGRPDREQRLLNEAAFARRVGEHPALPRLYGSGRLRDLDGCPYLSWEVVKGRDLNGVLILRYRIQPRIAMQWSRQLADALCAMHRGGVVHRDVTVTNVFIEDPDGDARVKLIDLSHSAFVPEPGAQSRRLTREFEIPGAHRFMPPEQTLSLPPHPKMDVFSFGVVLHEMLTGSNPFEHVRDRDKYIELQRAGKLEVPRLDRRVYPQVSEALVDLVEGCTRNDVAQRLDMVEVRRQLDVMLSRASAPVVLVGNEPQERTATKEPGLRAVVGVGQVEDASQDSRAVVGVGRVEAGPQDSRAVVGAGRVEPGPQDSRAVVGAGRVDEAPPFVEQPRSLLTIVLVALAMVVLTGLVLFFAWPRDADVGATAPATSERESTPGEVSGRGALPKIEPEATRPAEPEPAPTQPVVEPVVPTEPVEVAEPEPAVAEPEPAEPEPAVVEPEPEPSGRPTSKRKPLDRAKTPAHETDACRRTVTAASAAYDEHAWGRLESLTRKKKCFEDRGEWAQLRVRAFLETKRLDECIALAGDFKSPNMQRYAGICRTQKGSQ